MTALRRVLCGEYEHAGERQFGLVLCAHDDPARAAVVSGKHLAKALRAEGTDGSRRSNPMVVTLATCDSGNPGSVLGPGGSLAHDLHSEGIPWVFASQFPLTKAGSVDMARALYPGLLRGDDPRQVLYEMRRRLYLQFRSSHDWAGIVVYASVPSDFERSVVGFFEQQSRNAIEVSLGRADDLPEGDEQNQRLADARRVLDRWRANLPAGDHVAARERRAECYGIHGSTFKRIALMEYRTEKLRGDKTLREAMQHYRAAMAEGAVVLKFHWVATQALALAAALKDKPDPETFELAWHVARQGLHNPAPAERAWAHGTLAELEMISLHHKKLAASASQDIQDKVVSHCRDMLRLMGKTSFHVESTRRQFQRYVDHWNKRFTPIAQAAVDALS